MACSPYHYTRCFQSGNALFKVGEDGWDINLSGIISLVIGKVLKFDLFLKGDLALNPRGFQLLFDIIENEIAAINYCFVNM